MECYEQRIQQARLLFEDSNVVVNVLNNVNDELLELFLINFYAFGINMMQPVEDWLHRAGRHCEVIGLKDIGRALKLHARREAKCYLTIANDARLLITFWNRRHKDLQIDIEKLFSRPLPSGVACYQKLHEDIIISTVPYTQIAVSYEIELLFTNWNLKLVNYCASKFGKRITARLNAIQDHVKRHLRHVVVTRRELGKFLTSYPGYLNTLVQAGAQAIVIYQKYLEDCLTSAQNFDRTNTYS